MKLFQVAMILRPTKKEGDDGSAAQVIMQPTCILAPSEQAAAMLAGRSLDAQYVDKIDRIEVLVRPF